MVNFIDGDILIDANENIICQQTNCLGIMGGGLALQIAKKYPLVNEEYQEYCTNPPTQIFGSVQYVSFEKDRYIANMFSQRNISNNVRQTNYEAVYRVFEEVRRFASENNFSVAFPFQYGCGLGGGDWNVVLAMIYSVFGNTTIPVTIYKRQD